MSAISETYASLKDTFDFISGLEIMREYATEAFSIDVIEIAEISVRGCKAFSEKDFQTLTNMGWKVWTKNDESGAEFDKLKYVET
jgi:hypothetical protein